MTRRLVGSYLAIALVVLIGLAIPFGLTYAHAEHDRFVAALERDAHVISGLVEDELQFRAPNLRGDVDAHLASFPHQEGIELAIVDSAGRLIHPEHPDEVALLPDPIHGLAPALHAGQRTSGVSIGFDGRPGAHVTVPVTSGGQVHGAVYLHTPLAATTARIQRMWLGLAGLALALLAVTAIVGTAVARWTVRPLHQLSAVVARFTDGDLTARAPTDVGPPEERELVRRFNTMAEQLASLIGAQTAFVSDASHQLRNPLGALRLELEALQEQAPPALSAGIERALGQTHRMSRLVSDLLALARAEADSAPGLTAVDADAVLADEAELWTRLGEEEGVRLVVESGEAGPVKAVAGALQQIIDNLVDNAVEASPPGAEVRLWARREGDRVEIHIKDQGKGLSEQERARAFDRFWRAPEAPPAAGNGLGLAIARQLARASGGDVTLQPAETGGTDAVIVLPAAHGKRDQAGDDTHAEDELTSGTRRSRTGQRDARR